MPRFRYTALTTAGRDISGQLEAEDRTAAITALQLQGVLPISAEPDTAAARPAHRLRFRRPRTLPGRDLGLMRSPAGRAAVAGTLAQVQDGAGLADALAAQGVFPKLFLAMVRAGERGAALPGVLTRLADFLARMEALRQSVLSALIYPAILAVVAGLSVGLVLTVVLPQFEPLFQEAGSRLPVITRLVMTAGDIVTATWWMLPPVLVGIVLLWRGAMRRSGFARGVDALLLRLPLAGPLLTGFDTARFARTLGTLIANGVVAAAALPLAAEAVGNRTLAAALHDAATRLRAGEGLSGPLERTGRFPVLLTQLIRVGEESARLPDLLAEAADLLEAEAQRTVDRLLALLVPAITIGMGAIIGVIVAAMFLAMLSLNDLAL